MNNRFVQILLLMFLFAGCGKTAVSPAQYIAYVEDASNGLMQIREMGGYRFTSLYKPAVYMAIKSGASSVDSISNNASKYENTRNFTLRFEVLPQQPNEQELKDNLAYFLDYMAESKIALREGENRYSCLMFLREQTFGLAPYENVLLSFEAENAPGKDMILELDADVLGIGLVNFKVRMDDISSIPEIKQ